MGEVGQSYYAIAVRPGEEDLRQALDEALGRIARSGELRAILGRWRIDNAAQQRMAEWTDAQTREVLKIVSEDVRSWRVPGTLCAALYLAMSYPLSRLARRLEAKLARA